MKNTVKRSMVRTWAIDFGLTDRGVARLLGISPYTVVSWRKADRTVREPADWRDRIIAGLEREIERLRCIPEGMSVRGEGDAVTYEAPEKGFRKRR